jgi:hypothetical protein
LAGNAKIKYLNSVTYYHKQGGMRRIIGKIKALFTKIHGY